MTSLNEIVKSTNKTLKLKQFEDKFKTDMIKKWHEEFDTMWETKQLDRRLAALNELKQQYKLMGPNEKAWFVKNSLHLIIMKITFVKFNRQVRKRRRNKRIKNKNENCY